MDFILIAGLWLRSAVWDEVAARLAELGHQPLGVQLPGVDDTSVTATLQDHIASVISTVDRAEQPVIVGHSAASSLAWMAADRRPDKVSRVVLIGGFPAADGSPYADFFEPRDGLMPFPGWEEFEGPDSADLDGTMQAHLSEQFVPVPAGVSKGTVRLNDELRFGVPVTVVSPEFSVADAKSWIAAGDVPELSRVEELSFVDIKSGHWPMMSAAAELARLLHSGVR